MFSNEISKADNGHSHRRLEYQSAQLFIEEPEQNLYPESQKLVVMSLDKKTNYKIHMLDQSCRSVTRFADAKP